MEDPYGFHYSAGSSMAPSTGQSVQQLVRSGPSSSSDAVLSEVAGFEHEDQLPKALRAQIASHPLYPKLLDAYIDCHKVGESQEMAKLLDEIGGQNSVCQISAFSGGADPQLDGFMETYLNLLVKFKSDLSNHFDEATAFFNEIQTQLNTICNGAPVINNEATRSSEDFSREKKEALECKRKNEERELKDKLLRRYTGYVCSLKHEFSKRKQKKEKMPKESSQILLAWWNIHFKWPYPTETDKVALAEWTGLDQKQINNWFTNQRKRHWKPTEEMQASVVDGLFYGPHSQLHE